MSSLCSGKFFSDNRAVSLAQDLSLVWIAEELQLPHSPRTLFSPRTKMHRLPKCITLFLQKLYHYPCWNTLNIGLSSYSHYDRAKADTLPLLSFHFRQIHVGDRGRVLNICCVTSFRTLTPFSEQKKKTQQKHAVKGAHNSSTLEVEAEAIKKIRK